MHSQLGTFHGDFIFVYFTDTQNVQNEITVKGGYTLHMCRKGTSEIKSTGKHSKSGINENTNKRK